MNHNDLYQRWLGTNLEDADLSVELESIKGQEEEIFERFYRGKNAKKGGIGIGLSLSKAIIESQNGIITARNLTDGGACFEIRFYGQ